MSKFKVGDRVKAFGLEGYVIRVLGEEHDYPIEVSYGIEGIIDCFTSNGEYYKYHKEPSLVLIERPKNLIKRKITLYALLNNGFTSSGYVSKEHLLNEISKFKEYKIEDCNIVTYEVEIETEE